MLPAGNTANTFVASSCERPADCDASCCTVDTDLVFPVRGFIPVMSRQRGKTRKPDFTWWIGSHVVSLRAPNMPQPAQPEHKPC